MFEFNGMELAKCTAARHCRDKLHSYWDDVLSTSTTLASIRSLGNKLLLQGCLTGKGSLWSFEHTVLVPIWFPDSQHVTRGFEIGNISRFVCGVCDNQENIDDRFRCEAGY
jgi:hypothetical protein